MSRIQLLIACAFLLSISAMAQTPQGEAALKEIHQVMSSEDGGINFVYMEMGTSQEPVPGAPYTATAVTESTQLLADGNRIVNKRTSFIARDGQGRTRREETVGPVGVAANGPKVVFISDPTTKTDYILKPGQQTAQVVKRKESGDAVTLELKKKIEIDVAKEKKAEIVMMREGGGERRHEGAGEVKRVTLPSQVIEGVNCEGERVTRTIPAGSIGNEKPIEIVSETWTSPELHVLVMRKRSDPRMGETTYRLTDIKRGDPDPALFQVPNSYKNNYKTEPPPSRD